MEYKRGNNTFDISRYPKTQNRSLKPWSAADEYILSYLSKESIEAKSIVIYNDRFGFLSTCLNASNPLNILDYKSQEKALVLNTEANNLTLDKGLNHNPIDKIEKEIGLAIIKIPKSLDQFALYLYQVSNSIKSDGIVVCSFMTKHFSAQMIKIAERFFDNVSQSLAHKKSRLIILKSPKKDVHQDLITEIVTEENDVLKQYLGVFSAKKVDMATQFLMDNMYLNFADKTILDVGSGNGVLAKLIRNANPDIDIHLLDDSWLAVESSKLNLTSPQSHFHWDDNLDGFEAETFDFVVSNPPFHFGFENNIEITLSLFNGIKRVLKPNGVFQMVANKHLNYKTHLDKLFRTVNIDEENDKFVIYSCSP